MGGGGSAQGCRVERTMEEGSPVVRQGVRPAGAGDGLPIVAAQEQRRRGGPVGVGHGWAIGMGRPKRTVPILI
jgi:hypothetical protein